MAQPLFSEGWCAAAVRAFNDDPDAPGALRGWSGDVALVVEGAEPAWLLLQAPQAGSSALRPPLRLAADTLDARAPTYWAMATRDTWGQLIAGTLDPIAAIVQKHLRVRGDVEQIVSRLKYRGLAQRWLAHIRGGL